MFDEVTAFVIGNYQEIILWAGILTSVVGAVKKLAEKYEFWKPPTHWLDWIPKLAAKIAHGWGPVIVSYVLPGLALVPVVLADGQLSWAEISEVLQVWFGVSISANTMYLVSRLKGPKALRK